MPVKYFLAAAVVIAAVIKAAESVAAEQNEYYRDNDNPNPNLVSTEAIVTAAIVGHSEVAASAR